MARKIDPLNKKLYGSVTAMLTVTDIKAECLLIKGGCRFDVGHR